MGMPALVCVMCAARARVRLGTVQVRGPQYDSGCLCRHQGSWCQVPKPPPYATRTKHNRCECLQARLWVRALRDTWLHCFKHTLRGTDGKGAIHDTSRLLAANEALRKSLAATQARGPAATNDSEYWRCVCDTPLSSSVKWAG